MKTPAGWTYHESDDFDLDPYVSLDGTQLSVQICEAAPRGYPPYLLCEVDEEGVVYRGEYHDIEQAFSAAETYSTEP